ncbi:hypothetical protein JCM3765_000023 [Sporobolomyces pararoseus]
MTNQNSRARMDDRLARLSPTSFLSLPNDLLQPIMQEVYDADLPDPHNHSISEITINKRLFSVARSIWISHLVISEPQADQQLSALEDDELRCQSLRHLEVKIEDFSHLYAVVLSRQFPRLAKLTIHFSGGQKKVHMWAVDKVISRIGSLCHLEVNLNTHKPAETASLVETIPNFARLLSVSFLVGGKFMYQMGFSSRERGHTTSEIGVPLPAGVTSFEIRGVQSISSQTSRLLESMETALNHRSDETPQVVTLPLRRLWLPVSTHGPTRVSLDALSPPSFNKLLQLLPSSAVECLQFTVIDSIPTFSKEVPVAQSVRVLRLECLFSLKEKENFEALSRLLLHFPSLTHLQLLGYQLFGLGTFAESIAKLSDADVFLYPELSTLLLWLRTSNVKVFTFRNSEKHKREVRWFRKGENPDEKFERDCWTLMTSSTRSRKVIKQEEEEQTEGDPNGLAAAQEALSPRPQTSLLSLPDDLLLLIYEELYEDQYGDKNISPPVSEILVNKRIFNLARPIWFSRMTIDSSQLDQRLTGILRDEARRQDLRQLALSLEKSYANLIQFTLSSIPRLAHLRIQHDGGGSAKAFQLLVDYLSTSVCLDHVTLNSRASGLIVGNALSRRIDDAINSSANPPSFTVAQNGSPYSIHGRRRSYWWGIWPPGGDFNTLPCWHFKTFKQGLCMRGAIAREVIESLQTVARSLSVSSNVFSPSE